MERSRSNDRVVTGYRERATVGCHLTCAKWLDKLSSVLSCLALLILTTTMWVRNDYPFFQSRTQALRDLISWLGGGEAGRSPSQWWTKMKLTLRPLVAQVATWHNTHTVAMTATKGCHRGGLVIYKAPCRPYLGPFLLLCQLRGRSGVLSLPAVAARQVNSISTYSVFSISPLASIISFPF